MDLIHRVGSSAIADIKRRCPEIEIKARHFDFKYLLIAVCKSREAEINIEVQHPRFKIALASI